MFLNHMLIIWYVFVCLTACGREGEFVKSEVVGKNKKGQIKLPSLKEIYSDDSWQKTFSTFDLAPAAFSDLTPDLPNPSNIMPTLYVLFYKF